MFTLGRCREQLHVTVTNRVGHVVFTIDRRLVRQLNVVAVVVRHVASILVNVKGRSSITDVYLSWTITRVSAGTT